MKLKSKNFLKSFFIVFLLNSSFILSQDINNTIKEISTMDEIHNEIFTNTNNIPNNLKTVSDILGDENNELIDEKNENISYETSVDNNIITTEIKKTENNNEKITIEAENSEIDESITYTLPKIEKNFSDNSKNNSIKEKVSINNKAVVNKKHEYREREKKEDKFEEINDRTNRVTALGSAMGAVDLGSTPKKKIRLGAGVGNSSSTQAIAVGIGYAPTDRFRVNTKFSSSTNNINNNSISVGASYDLDL